MNRAAATESGRPRTENPTASSPGGDLGLDPAGTGHHDERQKSLTNRSGAP